GVVRFHGCMDPGYRHATAGRAVDHLGGAVPAGLFRRHRRVALLGAPALAATPPAALWAGNEQMNEERGSWRQRPVFSLSGGTAPLRFSAREAAAACEHPSSLGREQVAGMNASICHKRSFYQNRQLGTMTAMQAARP